MNRRKVDTAFNMISDKNNMAANIGPTCIAKSWIRVQDDFFATAFACDLCHAKRVASGPQEASESSLRWLHHENVFWYVEIGDIRKLLITTI